jgi:tetratricopeptide (TPR) repeat protein
MSFNWLGRLLAYMGIIKFSQWHSLREKLVIAILVGSLGWAALEALSFLPASTGWLLSSIRGPEALPAADPAAALTFLVVRLQGDETGTQTRHVLTSLRRVIGADNTDQQIRVLETNRILDEPSGGDLKRNRELTDAKAQKWLTASKADVLIWGEVAAQDRVLRLNFVLRNDQKQLEKDYLLTDHLEFPIEFSEDLGLVMTASVTAIAYFCLCNETQEIRAKLLRNVYSRLQRVATSTLANRGVGSCQLEIAIGDISYTLGANDDNPEYFTESVDAYHSVIENHACTAQTELFGRAWRNLGFILLNRARRSSDIHYLEQAVEALRNSEATFNLNTNPREWALIHVRVGEALSEIGESELDVRKLRESVSSLETALPYLDRQEYPLQWASTRFSLGLALLRLDGVGGAADLDSALALMHLAVDDWPLAGEDLGLFETRQLLAVTLWRLGVRDHNTARVEEAVSVLRETIRTPPEKYREESLRIARKNLGTMLQSLGSLTGEVNWIDQAIEVYRGAAGELKRDDDPDAWASANNDLALAILSKIEYSHDVAESKEAERLFRDLLTIWTPDSDPEKWSSVQEHLGDLLLDIGESQSDVSYLDDAIVAYRETQKVTTEKRSFKSRIEIQGSIASALMDIGRLKESAPHSRMAIEAYRQILSELSREDDPLAWATAQNNIGDTLLFLAKQENSIADLDEAIACFRVALQVMKSQKQERYTKAVAESLGDAEKLRETWSRSIR